MKQPKIRFKGFSGEWETPIVSEVFDIRNGYTPSKNVKEFWEGGTIPWFRMEDIRENGGILRDSIQILRTNYYHVLIMLSTHLRTILISGR